MLSVKVLAALALLTVLVGCGAQQSTRTGGQPVPAPPANLPATVPSAAPSPPAPVPVPIDQVITAHAFQPAQIDRVSRFRSRIGHGAPQYEESDSNMKHYLVPLPHLRDGDRQVPLYAPFYGQIWRIFEEHPRASGTRFGAAPEYSGHQVQVRAAANEGVNLILFHVTLMDGIAEGVSVRAGQQIGWANVNGNSFDIAVELWERNGPILPRSYFSLLPDSLFADYQRHGDVSRADFIITREHRAAHPLPWNSPEAQQEGWIQFGRS